MRLMPLMLMLLSGCALHRAVTVPMEEKRAIPDGNGGYRIIELPAK